MPPRRITIEERRARLGRRHHLAVSARVESALEAATGVVALHSSDPASVFLSAAARVRAPDIGAMERALYEERTLVRMLGMRRTTFVVPAGLAPIVQSAATRTVAVRERRNLVKVLDGAGIADDVEAWLDEVAASTLRALAARGEATAAELAQDEPRLRQQLLLAAGKPYEARQSVSTRLLFLLAAEGRIVRGRPRGSWISSQYRWSLTEAWLPGGMPDVPVEEARAQLVRQWLASFGPGTVADLRWWTGWTAGEVKRALARIDVAEVDLDGVPGMVLGQDVEREPEPESWVALLPALDPTPMGWAGRDWYLMEHGPALFDRSGNVGPTVWVDGRIVGGWAQRKTGEVVVRLLEDVGADAARRIDAEARRLATWLGAARVTPRFRTPLERELST